MCLHGQTRVENLGSEFKNYKDKRFRKCINVDLSVGYSFEKEHFEVFKQLILDGGKGLGFIARVVEKGQTWGKFNYSPGKRATETLKEWQRKGADETEFQKIFGLQDDEEDDDEKHILRQAVLLVLEEHEVMSPGLFQMRKPVLPTDEPSLEGRHIDGRPLWDAEPGPRLGSEVGMEDMFDRGDLVYLNHFMYVTHRTGPGEEQERDNSRIVLRGQLSKKAWITMQSEKVKYVARNEVCSAWETAEQTRQQLPFPRNYFCCVWMILGTWTHLCVHLTCALTFLALSAVSFLPEMQVNKGKLYIAAVALLVGVILSVTVGLVYSICLQCCVPRVIRLQQSRREELGELSMAIHKLTDAMGTISAANTKVRETASDVVKAASDKLEEAQHDMEAGFKGVKNTIFGSGSSD